MQARQSILNCIARILASHGADRSSQECATTCLAAAEELTGSSVSCLAAIDAGGCLHTIFASGPAGNGNRVLDPREPHGLPGSFWCRGMYWSVLLNGCSILSNDPPAAAAPAARPLEQLPRRSFLGVPLMCGGRALGVIGVADRVGGYCPEDREALEALAPALAAALDHRQVTAALAMLNLELCTRYEELEAVYRSAPIGMCVLDRDLRYRHVNTRMAEINGVPASDHLGKTVHEIIPHLADRAEALAARVLRTGEPQFDVEFIGTRTGAPRAEKSWKVQWLPLRTSSGEIAGINIVAEEITKQKRSETELKQSRDDLDCRVQERTTELESRQRELETLNAELIKEIKLRQQYEEELKTYADRLAVVCQQRDYLSRRMVDLLERDRREIGRALHDQIGQILTGAGMQLEDLKKLHTEDGAPLSDRILPVQELLREAVGRAKSLSRMLRVDVLERFGLLASIKTLVEETQRSSHLSIRFFSTDLPDNLRQDGKDMTLYRVVQESLTNVLKHAGAETVFVHLSCRDNHLHVSIEDDGKGFDYGHLTQRGKSADAPLGIIIMRERVSLAGGSFHVETAPGKGTCVFAALPLGPGRGDTGGTLHAMPARTSR